MGSRYETTGRLIMDPDYGLLWMSMDDVAKRQHSPTKTPFLEAIWVEQVWNA
jgi:hypothetical protein